MKQPSGSREQVSLDRTKLVGITGKGQKLGTEKHSIDKGISSDVKQPIASK